MVHSPHELPEIDEYGLAIANGYESRIVATPIISKASDAVRSISMKIRQCIFENENFLSLYRWGFLFIFNNRVFYSIFCYFQDLFAKGNYYAFWITENELFRKFYDFEHLRIVKVNASRRYSMKIVAASFIICRVFIRILRFVDDRIMSALKG